MALLEAILQIASLKCPDTTHLPLPMTSSAPELVPLISVLPPSRVHYRLSTSHSTHILTQFVMSRSNRVYKDNHFFFNCLMCTNILMSRVWHIETIYYVLIPEN